MHRLPSGRSVTIGFDDDEEKYVVALNPRLVALVDPDPELGVVGMELRLTASPVAPDVDTAMALPEADLMVRLRYLKDDGFETALVATVRWEPGTLVVTAIPLEAQWWTDPYWQADRSNAFGVWLEPANLEWYCDAIAALPVERPDVPRRRADDDEGSCTIWRGFIDAAGRALVERLPADLRTWRQRGSDVTATLDLGLPGTMLTLRQQSTCEVPPPTPPG